MASLSTIAVSPLIYPVVHRNTRRALMHRFPFGVYYRVDSSEVIVVAVMHGSRNPLRWKTRVLLRLTAPRRLPSYLGKQAL